jgi:hypothetical protein
MQYHIQSYFNLNTPLSKSLKVGGLAREVLVLHNLNPVVVGVATTKH